MFCNSGRDRLGRSGGAPCWRAAALELSRCRSLTSVQLWVWMETPTSFDVVGGSRSCGLPRTRAGCFQFRSGWSRARNSWNGPGRVSRAQDVLDKATAQKTVHEAEVAEGDCRFAQLQMEALKPVGEVLPQVSILQGQIIALIRERDAGCTMTDSEGQSK